MPYWFFVGTNVLTASFIGRTETFSGASSYTFPFTFSSPGSNRYLIAFLSFQAVSGAALSPAVTLGGVTATLLGSAGNGSGGSHEVIAYYALVPTNATQSVVISVSRNMIYATCALYDLEGVGGVLNSTVVANANTTTQTATFNAPAGCSIIAAVDAFGSAPAHSWSGISQDFADRFGTSSDYSFSGAHGNVASANPSLTTTDTLSGVSIGTPSGLFIMFTP